MSAQLEERFTAGAEDWHCDCGRVNVAGLSMCPRCGRRPPRGIATVTIESGVFARPTWQPKVRGVRLAFGVIVLNIAQQVFTLILVAGGRLESNQAIQLSLFMSIVFYAVVVGMLTGPLLTLQPTWMRGDPKTTRLLGAEVGVLAAGVLLALGWAASGHPVADTTAQALVSEGSLIRIVLAFLALAVVAPFVEELLFRGVVCESLRARGPRIAIFVSSLLFAVAHLHGIVYYTICGVVLGVLYWRRGLWASITAHAAFNGSLVLMAMLIVLGPTHLIQANGVTVDAPAGWQLAAGAPANAELAAKGPSGATFLVTKGRALERVDLDVLASNLNSGRAQLPPAVSLDGTARVTHYPAGDAVEVPVKVNRHAGVIVAIPRGAVVWQIEVGTAGSAKAKHDYPRMLETLTLPATVGAP